MLPIGWGAILGVIGTACLIALALVRDQTLAPWLAGVGVLGYAYLYLAAWLDLPFPNIAYQWIFGSSALLMAGLFGLLVKLGVFLWRVTQKH